MNWLLLKNSMLVSGGATFLAVTLGFAAALCVAAVSRGRHAVLGAVLVALVLPPFLVTNTWLDLLGQSGVLRRWLPLNIYSLGGAAALLALLHWPITTLLALGAWNRLEPAQLEADPALRGGALVRWVLWPMARVAIGQAALLTFVLALNTFAVPVILQVPVFPEELWLAFTTRLNHAGAWTAAVPMVLTPLLALLLVRRGEIMWPRTQGTASADLVRRQLGSPLFGACAALSVALITLALFAPIAQLAGSGRTWAELPNLFRAAPDVIWNSFAYAAAAATVCVACGLATWRLPLGLPAWVPFFIPGVLLGQAAIAALNETVVYGTVALVVGMFALRYFAIGWSGVALARRSVDRDLTDAARMSGARGWTLFRLVHWPQIAPQAAAAWYVIYLLCLWDVETLVLIYPPGGETLALRIFNFLHYGHTAQVNALCVTLLALAISPLVVWQCVRWVRRNHSYD
jgi:iron(III) transport system permease protein